jgi:hypothetical protein
MKNSDLAQERAGGWNPETGGRSLETGVWRLESGVIYLRITYNSSRSHSTACFSLFTVQRVFPSVKYVIGDPVKV